MCDSTGSDDPTTYDEDREYRNALIEQIPDAINQLIELMASTLDDVVVFRNKYSNFKWTKIEIHETHNWDGQLNGMVVRAYSLDTCYIYAAYISRYGGIVIDGA